MTNGSTEGEAKLIVCIVIGLLMLVLFIVDLVK